MSVSLKIFQVGNTVLNLATPNLIDSLSYSGKVESIRPLSAYEDVVRDNQYKQKNRTVKVKSILLDQKDIGADHVYEALVSMIGKPVPVIGYFLNDNRHNRMGSCCTCVPKDGCSMEFLCATGIVTKMSPMKNTDGFEPPVIDFTIELVTYWTAMNRMSWRVAEASQFWTNAPIDPTLDFTSTFPNCNTFFKKCLLCATGFAPIEYTSYNHIYDPLYMAKTVNFEGNGCEAVDCFGMSGDSWGYVPTNEQIRLSMKPEFYSAPPSGIFVIEGITGTGDITFKSIGTTYGFTRETFETIIKVERTNELLVANNYSALDVNDQIVFGDFTYQQNGVPLRNAMIVKDGNVMSDVQPVIATTGLSIGYIQPSKTMRVVAQGEFNAFHGQVHYSRV